MATTVDDLIALKDEAVAACGAVVAAWEGGDLASAARQCQSIVDWSERYDAADEADVCSLDEYDEKEEA